MSVDPTTLQPGDQIPNWQRQGTLDHWNRFAAANYEFAGHHMDDDEGRHEGFAGAFIMAPLSHAYVHAMLREWMEDDGRSRIVNVDVRLKSPLLRGRTLTAGGTVTAVRRDGDELLVDLDVWQEDETGTTLGKGSAAVAFLL
jgi:hypothetical protein